MIAEIYGILCQCFGEPPLSFDWEYTDRDKTYHCHAGLTPQSFYSRFVTQSYEDAVSLIHAPTRDKPFERTFTVRFLNNVADGRPVRYLNVTMDVLKKLAVKQLEAGFPVWFGSDVAHGGDRKLGAWFNELPPSAIPSTLVVDLEGRIAARVLGEVTESSTSPPDSTGRCRWRISNGAGATSSARSCPASRPCSTAWTGRSAWSACPTRTRPIQPSGARSTATCCRDSSGSSPPTPWARASRRRRASGRSSTTSVCPPPRLLSSTTAPRMSTPPIRAWLTIRSARPSRRPLVHAALPRPNQPSPNVPSPSTASLNRSLTSITVATAPNAAASRSTPQRLSPRVASQSA